MPEEPKAHEMTLSEFTDWRYQMAAQAYNKTIKQLKDEGGIIGLKSQWRNAIRSAAARGVVLSHRVLENAWINIGDHYVKQLRHDHPKAFPTSGPGTIQGVWLTIEERQRQEPEAGHCLNFAP